MQEKIVLITGATSGIGRETARVLAGQGARVVLAGRSAHKAASTAAEIKAATGSSAVDYLLADLSDQAQVRGLAQQFLQRYDRLDVLVNNAGLVSRLRQETSAGIEMTFAVNHLNYFLLTNLLLERLQTTALEHGSARIVNVSSRAHKRVPHLDFDDLQNKRRYVGFLAYARSKLANVLFTYELARRLAQAGSSVTANAVHPGVVATNMGRNNGWLYALGYLVIHRLAVTAEQGADPVVYLASSPEVVGVSGKYFHLRRAIASSPASYDQEAARRLWQVSEQLTGLTVEPDVPASAS
jgi:NAD(P)-dependent dehydrogenase (short-subunit alcohol dehydrogenase family)